MSGLFVYGLPVGAALIGAVVFFFAKRDSRRFDRVYGEKAEGKPAQNLFDHITP